MENIEMIEIINENEAPKFTQQNRYNELHEKLVHLKHGKVLKIPKNFFKLKDPRSGIYATVKRRSTYQVSIVQDDKYIYVKKLNVD